MSRRLSTGRKFISAVQARGVYGRFVQVPGHDHFEVVSNLARRGDLGRAALLEFLRKVLVESQ